MIKSFRWLNKSVPCYQVTTVNLHTGEFNQFCYNIHEYNDQKYLLKFSEYETTTNEMGYSEPKKYIKRAKELGYEPFNLKEIESIPHWNPKEHITETV